MQLAELLCIGAARAVHRSAATNVPRRGADVDLRSIHEGADLPMRPPRGRRGASVYSMRHGIRSGGMRAERLFAIILLAAFLVIAGRAHATARKEQPEAKTPGVAQKHPVRVSPYTVWRHQHDEAERGAGSHQAQRPQGQMKARRLPN